jgi:phage shock protein A
MSVLQRLGRVIKSNFESLLDKAENPAKLAELALADMDKALREGKRAVIESKAEVKRHEEKARLLRQEADGWHRKAAVALKAGDEPLARDALSRRHDMLTQAVAEDEASKQAKLEEEEVTRMLASLQVRRDTFAARKGTLVTEAELRKAKGKGLVGRLGAKGTGPTALDQYDEFVRKVEVTEAEQEIDEMLGVGKDAEVEGKLRRLEAGGNVDDELAALKARLDKPGGGKPGA